MLEFLEDHRQPVPRWLQRITPEDVQRGPGKWMARFLKDAFFYPGSGMDGSPIRQLEGIAHAFLFVDFGQPLDQIKQELLSNEEGKSGLYGHKILSMAEFDLAPMLARASLRPPNEPAEFQHQAYGFWAVLKRKNEGGRFALMALGAEGMTTLSALYPSTPPKGLLVQEYAFDCNPWGEWSAPLTRFSRDHWGAPPEWLIFGDSANFAPPGGDYECLGEDLAVESMHGSRRRVFKLQNR